MEVKQNEKIMTIPNILSFVRIILVPVFLVFYFKLEKQGALIATIILALSAFTDVIDGYIARKFNMVSNFGKMLDPIADKLTQASVVIAISIKHTEFVTLMALIVFKELLMFLGSLHLVNSGLRPAEAKWFGKLGTVAIYAFMLGSLVRDITQSFPYPFLVTLAIIAGIFTIFSFVNYAFLFSKIKQGEYDIQTEKIKK